MDARNVTINTRAAAKAVTNRTKARYAELGLEFQAQQEKLATQRDLKAATKAAAKAAKEAAAERAARIAETTVIIDGEEIQPFKGRKFRIRRGPSAPAAPVVDTEPVTADA
jgi:hypothetical protein